MPPVIDGFTDLVEVGRGGFGTVYRAQQLHPSREVAVKVLPDVRADSDAYGRFTREFQALAAVGGHPNIATVHACGVTADGSGYLAIELLLGGSLGDRIRSAGAAPWADVATWGVQLAGALETAHRAGITHRDIKPENVLFDAAGTPKLVDFGIAGVPGAYRTATGSVTLTLAHAAPEVVAGGRGGVPGDVYSLASSLYAAVAGSAAFVAEADETLVPMLARIATAPVPDLRPRGVPDSVCTALERGMAKDPVDRPSSAEAFGMSLQAALAREGITAAAPLLLLSPGVAAPFVVSDAAPAVGVAAASAVAAGVVEGDRTITGWVAPIDVASVASVAAVAVAPEPSSRRRSGMFAAAASLAAVLALMMVWRGFDAPAPAAAGSVPTAGASGSAQPTPTPSRSSAAATSPSASPSASAKAGTPSAGSSFIGVAPSPRSTASSSAKPTQKPSGAPSRSPSTAPAPTPDPTTATPPPVVTPLAPRKVRAGGAAVVRGTGGAPAQVSVRVSWQPATSGPAATAYEVRYTAIGGPAAGTATLATTITATTATLLVPAPDPGTRYRWQVRAILGTVGPVGSAWAAARAAVPQLVGRRAAQARTALRALGLSSSTYKVLASTAASVGRVVAQSVPRGRLLTVGSSIALGIGKAAAGTGTGTGTQ